MHTFCNALHASTNADWPCCSGLAALKLEYDVGKNPGIFDTLVTLVPSQLTAQVPSLCLSPFHPLVLLVSPP